MSNLGLKSILGAGVLALALSGQALAADLPTKYKAAPVAAAPDFDIAFGGGIMSDYIFRGITQSNHAASPYAYFEPHYKDLYIGIAGTGIDFNGGVQYGLNNPSAEIDLYGGWRPTVGKWSFDLGYIYYAYPKALSGPANPGLFNIDFYEIYGKATLAVTDALAIGGAVFYTPNLLNNGSDATYWEVNTKYVVPSTYFAANWGGYVSGAYGHWDVGGYGRSELQHLECGWWPHLQNVHARPSLERHRPEQGNAGQSQRLRHLLGRPWGNAGLV